jgi:2'-5' RNA ligase
VLWLGIEDKEERLLQLQQRLEDECFSFGFEREARAFHPHLTLARLRKPQGAKELAAAHRELGFSAMEMTVGEIYVMRSELNPLGSRYSEVTRHGLC